MTFYKNYLRGVFGNHAGAIIVVNGNTFRVWEYEESAVGEKDALNKLASEPSGTFASPAKGYWMSNLITEQKLSDPRYDTMRWDIGLMMSGSSILVAPTDIFSINTPGRRDLISFD